MTKSSNLVHRRNFILHLQERPEYNGLVLLKEPAHQQLTRAQIAQLHNEHTITRQLRNVAGVRPVYAIEGSETHPVLLLKFIQGRSLVEIIQRQSLDLPQKLQLAVEIVGILGRIHDQGVIHRDICSSNILVAEDAALGEHGGVYIIDLGLATTMGREEPATSVLADALAGSLAYIAPEQTGRMDRSVDHRSDLYSLGVTLYELFTGQLPFRTHDAVEMIHAHMAVWPVPPRQLNGALPEPLSEILLKLMTKNAEDRYWSAQGLGADLVRCLDQLQRTRTVEPFELGQDDLSDRLQIPQQLYGREYEIAELMTTYDRVAQGRAEITFVAGYSGVGKTSLVHEIRGEVLARGGIFLEGKFDQLRQTLPYSAWAEAFTQLVNYWLAESESDLARWRNDVLDALGNSGQILIDIIPALEHIIGPQPDVPQLSGVENQNRLNYTFNRFISTLAKADHPLVVFLDDLQWIDLASLNLIEALMASQGTGSFLVIGAYRDNEVGADHPLVASQNRIREATDRITVITLGDLATDDISHLLADTLQLTAAECRNLGQVLVDKTAGNPFYFRQLLYALESEKELRFDRQKQRWVWTDALPQSLQAHGSAVDLMISKIHTLPAASQHTLSIAACLGSRFDTSTLNIVTAQPEINILTALSPAAQMGLIIQSNGYFSFAHDRIQEAGYALIPTSDLQNTHLEIGRRLLKSTPPEDLKKDLFAIVGHLNAGRALIDNDSERHELATLNLVAGQRAKAKAAYSEAKDYIEIGLDLIGPDNWQEHYELTLTLHNENGELAVLTGQYDQVSTTADLIHANARNVLDQVRIYMTEIEAETGQYNLAKGLEIGLAGLRDLGFVIPAQPTAEDNRRLHERLIGLLTSKPMERLAQLPAMSDGKPLAASSLFASVMSTAYIANPSLFPTISYNGAILTLEFGLDVWSPFFVGGVALVNFSSIDRETPADEAFSLIQFNKQLVEIIRQMLDNPITARSRTKGLMMLAFVVPWIEPIEQGIEISRATYQNGREAGDLLYASYGAIHFAIQGLAAGVNLSLYESQLSDYVNSLNRVGQKTTPQWLSIYLQTAQNFEKISPEPDKLNGTFFSENDWLPDAITANDISGRHFFYNNKLMLVYHFDVDDKLDEYAGLTEGFLTGASSLFSVPLFHFYFALAKLRSVGGSRLTKHPRTMNLINKSLHWLGIWSEAAPSSFQHKFDLVAAEKARVRGDLDGALSHYEQAISGARENGFTHEEALANELYARFWLERDNERFASLFMREAHSLYRKWGALAKSEHLTKRYPNLMIGRSVPIGEPRTGIVLDQMSDDLDLITILRASQAIAGEIELGRLLGLLMTGAIENSGAQRGFLLLQENGQWMIVARSEMDKMDVQLEQPTPVAESDLLSQRIAHYVARTQQTVLLADASQSSEFVDDAYVDRNEVKSLLCTPLVNQGKTSAILYLENNLSPGTFTPDRVELLCLLSAQMAISIDNARTHDRLEQLLEERSRALNSAEAQIRTIFDNSPVGISLTSLDGRFLAVNNAVLHMLRISEEEVLQRNVADFYADPNDRLALLTEVRQSASAQGFGLQMLRNDGSSFFASLNMSRIIVDAEAVLLAMIEDVTDELSAEQEAAAQAERERLARELHDSVSQTLFTAGMLSDALPRLLARDQAMGRNNMDILSRLIRGASAEMRSLLLELRPDTLKGQTLDNLLETLATAARARTQAAISLEIEGDCSLPEKITMAFHRIAQESLNNIAKHAEASQVEIELECDSESTKLRIQDDGRGFDPEAIPAGHLGIGIMCERAHNIGADIKIDSKIGRGTQVSVAWSASGDRTGHE